jgi:hypothetical protein
MNYHIDKNLLEQGRISITVDGQPITDKYFLGEISEELNDFISQEAFHKNKKPTIDEQCDFILKMLLDFEREWAFVNCDKHSHKIMTIHDYILIKKFEDLSGTEDLPF